MMSIGVGAHDLQRLGAVVGLEYLAHADGAQNLGEQHAHVVVVVHQQHFQEIEPQPRLPARPFSDRALPAMLRKTKLRIAL